MADLPDLDTGSISFIAYWNAIDQGGAPEIDPLEATSSNGVVEYTTYDNGVDMVYDTSNIIGGSANNYEGNSSYNHDRTVNVRVKNDGWVVAWMDRTEDYTQSVIGNQPNFYGIYDIIYEWVAPDNNSGIQTNTLERVIQNIHVQFSNSDIMTYNTSDVGLYDFIFGGTTVSCLSYQNQTTGNSNNDVTFQYTSDTELHYGSTVCSGAFYSDSWDSRGVRIDFEGVEVAYCGNSGAEYACVFGSREILDNNLIPDPETSYGNLIRLRSSGDATYSYGNANVLTIWS